MHLSWQTTHFWGLFLLFLNNLNDGKNNMSNRSIILGTILDKYFQLMQKSHLGQVKLLSNNIFVFVKCSEIELSWTYLMVDSLFSSENSTPTWGGYWRGSLKSITFRYLCLESNRAGKKQSTLVYIFIETIFCSKWLKLHFCFSLPWRKLEILWSSNFSAAHFDFY